MVVRANLLNTDVYVGDVARQRSPTGRPSVQEYRREFCQSTGATVDAETSICVSSPTLSVARPVAVMVTSHRRHAVMIPDGPNYSTPAAMSPLSALDDEHPQFGDDAEDRAGHRTVERADEHDPEPVPEEERELREDRPRDEDRSANRPQSAQIVLRSVIESRSKLGTE